MPIENKLYKNFKPYSQYQAYTGRNVIQQKKTSPIAPVIGSAIGVGAGMLACKKLPKSDSGFVEAARTLVMAIGGNIGGGNARPDLNNARKIGLGHQNITALILKPLQLG